MSNTCWSLIYLIFFLLLSMAYVSPAFSQQRGIYIGTQAGEDRESIQADPRDRLDHQGGDLAIRGNGSYIGANGSGAIHDDIRIISIDSGGSATLMNDRVNITQAFVNQGTVNAGNSIINVMGNFDNYGTFNAANSTVVLDLSRNNVRTIRGSTSFHNFNINVGNSAANEIRFQSNATQTIRGNFAANYRDTSDRLVIRSSASDPARLDFPNTNGSRQFNIGVVDVADVVVSGAIICVAPGSTIAASAVGFKLSTSADCTSISMDLIFTDDFEN